MFKRAAWSRRDGSEQGHLSSYDNEQWIDLQVAAFAITVTVSVMALIYYVNWP
jgi:hypothetical protein